MKSLSSAVYQLEKEFNSETVGIRLVRKMRFLWDRSTRFYASPTGVGWNDSSNSRKKNTIRSTLGLPQLRELVAEKYRSENNLTWVEPKNIIITNGVVKPFSLLMQFFLIREMR